MRSKWHRRPIAGDTPEAPVVRGFTMLQVRSRSRECLVRHVNQMGCAMPTSAHVRTYVSTFVTCLKQGFYLAHTDRDQTNTGCCYHGRADLYAAHNRWCIQDRRWSGMNPQRCHRRATAHMHCGTCRVGWAQGNMFYYGGNRRCLLLGYPERGC
jgi:hypothetical protein